MSPKESIQLLGDLVELGFTNEAFSHLHHFRLKDRNAYISAHLAYCEKTESFRDNEENERVQRRLRLVLNAYRAGGFVSRDPSVFVALADAAFYDIPSTI